MTFVGMTTWKVPKGEQRKIQTRRHTAKCKTDPEVDAEGQKWVTEEEEGWLFFWTSPAGLFERVELIVFEL